MMPATGGLIEHDDSYGDRCELRVTGTWRTPETVIVLREYFGVGSFVEAHIVLDEQERRELIVLLGGTP